MTKEEVDLLLENSEFQFAKTMAKHPHSYTLLHKHWNYDKKIWFEMVEFIWNNSVREHWKYGHYYNYYYANGYKYWSMDKTILTTDLINRAKV